jgi:hypothetical protein|tara:strand:- start:150 stop:491 length:342 start_codon:yes stop_codon:yes gene_type:complete
MEQELHEDKLSDVVIDLNVADSGELNESFLRMFGYWTKKILERIFGGSGIPVQVRGTRSQVDSFASALGREKKYMQAINDYGLDDPRTYKQRGRLDSAVAKFERTTGLVWPFK